MFYVFIFDFSLVALLFCAIAFFVWCWSWVSFGEDRKRQPVYLRSNSVPGKAQIKERTKRYA